MGTKTHNNYEDLITFTRASAGHALRPVSYGSEILTNGTFDTDLSDWTTGANVTSAYSSGEAQLTLGGSLTSTGGNWFRTTDEVFEAGKLYRVTFDATYVSGTIGTYGLQAGHGYTEDIRVKSSGTYTFTVDSTIGVGQQTDRNKLTFGGESTGVWKIDNVSVKEVTFDESDGTLTLFEHPDNIPRVEYDADGNRLGLLVEKGRTNLLPYSEDFSNAAWLKQNLSSVTAVPNSLTGNNDAYELVENSTASVQHRIYDTVAISNATGYSSSVYAKRGTGSRDVAIISVPAGMRVYFNLEDGTVGQETNGTGQIIYVGDGWYRCTATGTSTSTSTSHYLAICDGTTTGSETYNGDGTSSVILFGAQLETGSFPTSYIKTTGSTATRSADVAKISVADFGYNQGVGTLFAEYFYKSLESAGLGRYLELNAVDAGTDRVLFYHYQSTGNTTLQIRANSVTQAGLNASTPLNQTNKVAGAFDTNDVALVANGGSALTDTAAVMPTNIVELDIGSVSSNINDVGVVYIKSIKYYPRRLTDAQLQEITS